MQRVPHSFPCRACRTGLRPDPARAVVLVLVAPTQATVPRWHVQGLGEGKGGGPTTTTTTTTTRGGLTGPDTPRRSAFVMLCCYVMLLCYVVLLCCYVMLLLWGLCYVVRWRTRRSWRQRSRLIAPGSRDCGTVSACHLCMPPMHATPMHATYIYICICIYICMHIHMHAYTYACICTQGGGTTTCCVGCMHACMHTHMYYIHINMHACAQGGGTTTCCSKPSTLCTGQGRTRCTAHTVAAPSPRPRPHTAHCPHRDTFPSAHC